MATLDVMTLLQRQMEVSGALRKPVKTEEELLEIRIIMSELSAFITQVGRVSTKLQLPLELVFQCLMQLGMGSEVDFDKQHRSGAVPMHQAKVLNRNAALNAQSVEPKLRGAVDEETLSRFIHQSGILRNLLRMKVEDGNDLSMARKMIELSNEYLNCIYNMAGGNGNIMFAIFVANDENEISMAMGGGSQSSNGGLTSDPSSPTTEVKPLPKNVIKGLAEEIKQIATSKISVAIRLATLRTIENWFQVLSDDQFACHFTDVVSLLQEPMKIQLSEKRSAICRAACDVVSLLCIRSRPHNFGVTKVKECFHAWCEVVIKGVHVTVAAIATATDAVLRDMIVSSEGAPFICVAVANTFQRAAQPELKRKCLNYLIMGLCAKMQRKQDHNCDKEYLSLFSVAAQKAVGLSEEGVRRTGRILTVLIIQADATNSAHFPIDAKLQKLLDQDSANILPHIDQMDAMEIVVLRYAEPCKASAFCEEKLGDPSSQESPKRISSHQVPLADLKENDSSLRHRPSIATTGLEEEQSSVVEQRRKLSSPVPVSNTKGSATVPSGKSTKGTAMDSCRPSENLPPVTRKSITPSSTTLKKTNTPVVANHVPINKRTRTSPSPTQGEKSGSFSSANLQQRVTSAGSAVPLSLLSLSGEFANCVSVDEEAPSPTAVPPRLLSSLKARRSSSRQDNM